MQGKKQSCVSIDYEIRLTPRMRGECIIIQPLHLHVRLTTARAGRILLVLDAARVIGVDPRACGVNARSYIVSDLWEG